VRLPQRRMARPSLGGMLATRQGALLLALLCAACAAGILVIALSSYKQSVQTTVKQATVLIATGEIQKGTTGDQIASEQLYKATPVVATQLQADAIGDASELQGKIAASDILPGQQLTTADFTTTLGAGSLLAPNQRALSIPSDEIHNSLGIVNPGDRVDLYEEWKPSGSAGSKPELGLIDPNVLVLKTPSGGLAGAAAAANGTTSSGQAAGSSAAPGTGAMVLALTSAQVPAIALTADNGTLWMALRPANATGTVGGIITLDTVLAQAQAAATAAASSNSSNSSNSKNHTNGGHP
jgi:Flp pilus assembly protein CpaB